MQQLKSYLGGRWVTGEGQGSALHDPATNEVLATTSTKGLDLGAALAFAREKGGAALRAMTFAERGALLTALSKAIHAHRDELLEISLRNTGTTLKDAKFDVDGGTATMAAYGRIGEELGDRTFLLDGERETLGRSPRFCGQHIKVPLRGVAVHINAFNFPVWGFAEKLACAFLAGMPVLTKPGTSTALPASRVAEIMVESGLLPEGAWSFLCGGAGDLLDHMISQDVIAFTGSAATGERLRGHPNVVRRSIRINIEADSLNAAVVGPDLDTEDDTWDLFLREVSREIAQKSGQKCTATRRVFVPENLIEAAVEGLKERLADYPAGLPDADGVRMGVLAAPAQMADVCDGLNKLNEVCDLVHGEIPTSTDGPALVAPLLFVCRDPKNTAMVHELEVFGPSTTIMPYTGDAAEVAALVNAADGGLVAAIYSDDLEFAGPVLLDIAPYHGRVLLGSKRIAEYSTGPGMVLPNLNHGGPGRAGGGSELGGARGLNLYMQTCAVQGARPMLDKVLG